MRVIQLKFKNKPVIFFQNGGARARRAGPGSAFVLRPIFLKVSLLIACYITLNAAKVDPPQNIGLGH